VKTKQTSWKRPAPVAESVEDDPKPPSSDSIDVLV
jgi:hypothetical protein